MEISACFSEILTQVDLLIKKQKEQINNAIDIPNWGEAQNVIKQAYENTSALKTLKEKAVQLQQEFENTGLFTEEAGAGTEEQPGSVEKSIPVKKNNTALITDISEKKEENKNESDISSASELVSATREATESAEESFSGTESQQLAIPNAYIGIPDEAWLSLSEDYQNTKIKAVRIDKKVYYVKDMTDALVNVCESLYKKDSNRFVRMLNARFAHGTKQKYLSDQPFDISYFSEVNPSYTGRFYKKMSNAEIYIWVNTTSNAKANLMSNMLTYFGLPKDTVKLAVREDYNTDGRDYNGRNVIPTSEPAPLWQDDPSDSNVYSKPIVHEAKATVTNTQSEKIDTATSKKILSEVVECDAVIKLCEDMILKYPYKMAVAFGATELCQMFIRRKNYAVRAFKSPHRLSNGIWVETEGITSKQLEQIKKYCSRR